MTVSKNISLLQSLLRDFDNNLIFEREFLYTVLLDARAQIMSKKLDEFKNVGRYSWQKFCMELVEGDIHSCGDCIPEGLTCKAYITTYKVPEAISGKIRDYMDVMTMDNKIIDYIPEQDVEIIQYDDYRKRKPFYSIVNNYIILWNTKIKSAIQLRGLWYDPMQWVGIQLCNSSTGCISASEIELPMPTGLRLTIFNLALELLRIPLKLTEQDLQSVEENLNV